jgi:hypothetical protein
MEIAERNCNLEKKMLDPDRNHKLSLIQGMMTLQVNLSGSIFYYPFPCCPLAKDSSFLPVVMFSTRLLPSSSLDYYSNGVRDYSIPRPSTSNQNLNKLWNANNPQSRQKLCSTVHNN